MIYKFKSKASGDVIMLGPHGDQVLRAAGKEPAPQGIFEVAHMPAAIAALERAVAAEEVPPPTDEAAADTTGLRQRAWPLIEMLKRSHAAGADIVWGV